MEDSQYRDSSDRNFRRMSRSLVMEHEASHTRFHSRVAKYRKEGGLLAKTIRLHVAPRAVTITKSGEIETSAWVEHCWDKSLKTVEKSHVRNSARLKP